MHNALAMVCMVVIGESILDSPVFGGCGCLWWCVMRDLPSPANH